MVWNQHRFMVGIDYTDDHFALPLYWLVIAALIAGAGLVMARRWIATAAVVGVQSRAAVDCAVDRRRALREAQRNLAGTPVYPDAHRSHARRVRP